ncbi:NAD(P)/FAD-dependent oxidoreductase [Desulforapulum autotrophicum]|uniref:NAD(P)/FAD-dependent oxidoreductase n=1 Tax=Desulforapulum autotrophicum TaxID=2296 RepID=UPI0002E93C57|nr:FAD-dependent oxidoreductase [Desulforapulum autotrophicum]
MDRNATQYLIVGGSAAGMAAAHTIRSHDPMAPVTVLTDETDKPYFRPMIPFVVSGKKKSQDMAMEGCGPYVGKDIFVKTDSRVVSVDTDSHRVFLENNQVFNYGKILFATGSRPFIPPDIKGTESNGVFALRTLAHARKMNARAAQTQHAVLLGGGLLNLKAAFALLERGIKVTLVVYSPQVLSQLMDAEDAVLIRNALDDAGLEIRTGTAAVEIESDNSGVRGIVLDDHTKISCQMVCIGKGVRPNVEFLENSKIKLEKGIVADIHTACSQSDTFAAGDVAVTHDPVSGKPVMTALWTNAVEMGRCAGLNMAGLPTAYAGTFGILNATQIANMPFVSMGLVHTKDLDCEIFRSGGQGSFRKMVFSSDGRHLIGMVLIGDISNAGLYRHVIQGKKLVEKFKHHIIGHNLHWGHFIK